MSFTVPISKRLYHIITTMIVIFASLSYFAMASGHATTYNCSLVKDHHGKLPSTHHRLCREVFPARYIDWAITTPLLLLDLSLLAGIDGAHTLMAIVADLIMIFAGLLSAYGDDQTAQKWGWFSIACISYLFVIWHVAVHGARTVRAKGSRVTTLFASLAGLTLVLWTAYPIVWGVAGGVRKVTVDSEVIAYAVLDILAKPVFGLWLLIAHRQIPETNVELGGFWSQGLPAEGRIRIGDDDEGA